MKTWLAKARDAFHARLWPVPTIAVVVALLLGLALPELDGALRGHLSSRVSGWLFGGDADAARSLLGVISSSLITVTSLTFSLTVVTLQLASSQFSPRLLRTFTSDQFVQATLALFLATFTYALTVLRAVRSANDHGQSEFVPALSVTVAFVLAIASVLGLVLFLAHLTQQIRAETMLHNVHRDAATTLRTVLSDRATATSQQLASMVPPLEAVRLVAQEGGFLTWADQRELLRVAMDEDVLVSLDVYPGSFLVEGTPVGVAWSLHGDRLDAQATGKISDRVGACLELGFERTAAQDIGHGLRQLTDVAIKALSPGINDPTTAIHALGHISEFLCTLADHDLGTQQLWDEDELARVAIRHPDLASFVDLGISQPRRYGASDPDVLERIYQVLLDLSYRVAPAQRGVVRAQLIRLNATVAAQSFDAQERAGLAVLARRVEENLTGDGPKTCVGSGDEAATRH